MLTANATTVVTLNEDGMTKAEMSMMMDRLKQLILNGAAKDWHSPRIILSDGTEINDFSAKIEGSFSRKVAGSEVEDVHIILAGGIIINFDDMSRRAIDAGL